MNYKAAYHGSKTIYQDFQLWNGAGYRLKFVILVRILYLSLIAKKVFINFFYYVFSIKPCLIYKEAKLV